MALQQSSQNDPLSFEKVWLMFQDTDKKFQETDRKSQETDRQIKETDRILTEKFRETDKKFQDTEKLLSEKFQETREQMRDTDKKIKELATLFTGQWGKLIESLVEGDLINLLNARDVAVTRTATRELFQYGKINGEIDIIAKNTSEVVPVEVKTTLKPADVKEFLDVLSIFKKAFPEYSRMRVYGAVAFLKSESEAHKYAERMGLFVIRATGNSASIINTPNFKPVTF